jgi:NitT/TauT family transport system substrate-binding protein
MSRESGAGGSICLFAFVVALLLGLPALAQTAGSATLTPLKFRQSFIPSEQYIPEQTAIDEHLYEAQGLSVEVLRSTGGGNAATLVAAGGDQVGVAGASDLLIARGKGLDIVAIGLNTPQDPTALISLSSNPIRSIADLRGKRIGVIAGSTAFALLQALLKAHNLTDQDVNLVLIGAGDLVSSVLTQRVDAIAAFETTNVPGMRAAGANPVSLRFADIGMRVPGNVYIANGAYARAHPDVIARFMAGTIRGWEEVARDDGKDGLSLLIKAYPELADQKALLAKRWEFRGPNGYNPYSSGKPFTANAFKFDPRSIATLNTALVGAGSVPAGMDLHQAFSDQFVDAAEKLLK